ncbi:MAG: proline dehydrogenase family protein, partial [Candidatus Caenarcaniphilales bacterium]|nr:proline dehydrogenase family protein [Candidatus Caenarcaniphilales bacterium]
MLTEYQIGKEMFAFIKAKSFQSDLNKFFKNLLLRFSTNNPRLQQQLFRFVDVLPSLKTTDQVNQLLVEYLGGTKTFIAPIVNFAAKLPLLDSITHKVINFSAQTMAKSFIAGSNTSEALDKISQLERQGLSYTLDLLGEIALTEEEASLYHEKYLEIIRSIDQVNLSIKLSSLAAQIHPLDFKSKKQIIKNRLRDIYKLAIETGASINVDSEHFHFKEITFEILEELLSEPDFINWTGAGIVIQAYLKDSYMDLVRWINIAKSRRNPITIRLVKGAYWDYEVAIARQKSWDCPVYEFKSDTDANYEKLTEVLLQNHHYVRPAIASHNIRSLAHAIRIAQVNEVPQTAFEIQMLYGMLDELKGYFPENNFCLRVYLPYGELIPGMSYLVRRLLENTANDSFLKQGFLNKSSEDELLLEPHFSQYLKASFVSSETFTNSAGIDFYDGKNRNLAFRSISDLCSELYENKSYPLLIASGKVFSDIGFESVNPASTKHVLGRVSLASYSHCDHAIYEAKQSQKVWAALNVIKRAEVLKKLAKEVENFRMRFIGLLVLEAGKTWLDADAEVSELVDFLNYYADQ